MHSAVKLMLNSSNVEEAETQMPYLIFLTGASWVKLVVGNLFGQPIGLVVY